jgi:hypothetical protein
MMKKEPSNPQSTVGDFSMIIGLAPKCLQLVVDV